MNIFKKINRNAFNEKLIHRYLFERYYFGNTKIRNKLLPERLHSQQINLIVPEDSNSEARYRADLTIYFRGQKNGIPVEVKWLIGGLIKENQIEYLKKHEGFLVILGDTNETKIKGVDVVSIEHDDFSEWIAENISRLSRESLIYQAESKKFSNSGQYWVVFLKGGPNGSAVHNFDRMLNSISRYPFWAFRQNPVSLPHILDMQKGDKILFIFATGGKAMAQPKDPHTKITVHRFYIGNIIEPYYMSLDNNRGLFFEDHDLKPGISDRRWPHFIDFEITKGYFDKDLNFGEQSEYSEAFANSFN